jgi:hypothetical protein
MPRIYTSDNDPLDFCQHCFPKTEDAAFEEYGNVGDGPDGRGNCFGYDAEHPDYVTEGYCCHICKELLQDGDN